MSLASLPADILRRIGFYLRSHELECLGRTFSHRITPTCLSLLTEWLGFAGNQRVMVQIFGDKEAWTDAGCFRKLYETFGEELPPFSPPDVHTIHRNIVDYVASRPDLSWLAEDLDPFIQSDADYSEMEIHANSDGIDSESSTNVKPQGPSATVEDMQVVEDSVMRLGLTLPRNFVRFMTDPALRKEMWRVNPKGTVMFCPELNFTPHLHKIISHKPLVMSHGGEDAINGYVIQFEAWGLGMNYLYLHRNGGHCVVQSLYSYHWFKEEKLRDPGYINTIDKADITERERYEVFQAQFAQEQLTLNPLEQELNVTAWSADVEIQGFPGRPFLAATSFEKFLAEQYFLSLASMIERNKSPTLPAKLKEYVSWIMTS